MEYRKKKNGHRQVKNIIFMLAFVAILVGMMTVVSVLAADQTRGSISLECPAEGMELSLYRVADYEDSFTLTGKFQNYQVSLDQKDQDSWKGAARTLADYIGRDGIDADAVTKSGSDRSARFEDLSRGLYLVSGKEIEVQENGKIRIYTPQASLVALPDSAQENPYNRDVFLKYDDREKQEASSTRVHVLKVWKQDREEKRPASVQVELLQTDSKGKTTVVDRQILNQENQWSYTWEDLSSQASWSVTERNVPSGYTVSTSQQGSTVVLTNTAEEPGGAGDSGNDSENTGQKLPQTGQLWWPVPLLMLVGVMCLLAGKVLRRSGDEKKKNDGR